MENEFGAVAPPAHARPVEAHADEVADGAFHSAGPDVEVFAAELGITHAATVFGEVLHDVQQAVAEVAKAVLKSSDCPALKVMLEDPSATLFRSEDEIFVACFTDDTDQWVRRHPGGAALVFDAKIAGGVLQRHELGGSGMTKVMYDANAVRQLALDHFLAIASLATNFPADGSLSPTKDDLFWRSVAQWMQEPGVLAFFTKDPARWSWEREWRLVKRTGMLDKSRIVDGPPRRLELPLSSASGLRTVVLAPDASGALECELRELLQHWPGIALVRARST